MNICIFGGTFNPIHNGHIGMCFEILKRYKIDLIYIVPAGDSYFKKNVLDKNKRADMVQLALKDAADPRLVFSSVELDREGHSYSADTVLYFKNNHPNDNLFFMIGEDSINKFFSWYHPEIIINNSTLLISTRNNSGNINLSLDDFSKKIKNEYNKDSIIFDYYNDISSSYIRELVLNRKNYKNFVSKSVYDYIEKNKLYLDVN